MVLCFLIATLASTPALAKDRPTVAVVGLHDGDLDLEGQRAAVDRITEWLNKSGDVDAWGPDEVARALAGREELVLNEAYVSSGRRLLEDGRTLHDQAQPEEAIPVLEQAVETLLQAMSSTDASRELWETYLYLGSSYAAENRGKEAKATWAAAVALNPERQPDAARLAPGVVSSYRSVLTEQKTATGSLSITAPGGATVRVNGVERGTGSVSIPELPPGISHVRIKGEDGATAYQSIEVKTGKQATVALKLASVSLPQAGESTFARSSASTALYKALGQQTKADLVLVAGGSDGKASIQLYAPPADAFTKSLELPYEGTSDDEILAALPGVIEVLTDAGTIPALATAPTAAPLEPSQNPLLATLLLDPQEVVITNSAIKPWQMIAGGAGALLIGGGVTAAILAGGGAKGGTIIVGPVP